MFTKPKVVCSDCGTINKTKMKTKGSILVELIMWLLLVVPGLIYSFWRVASRHKVCKACGSDRLIPLDSPMARKVLKDLE